MRRRSRRSGALGGGLLRCFSTRSCKSISTISLSTSISVSSDLSLSLSRVIIDDENAHSGRFYVAYTTLASAVDAIHNAPRAFWKYAAPNLQFSYGQDCCALKKLPAEMGGVVGDGVHEDAGGVVDGVHEDAGEVGTDGKDREEEDSREEGRE